MRRKYDQLVERVQFLDMAVAPERRRYRYSSETLMPYIYFFKYLAKRPYDAHESEQERR